MKLKGKNRALDEGISEVLPKEGEEVTNSVENSSASVDLPPELTDPTNPKYQYVIKNKKARAQVKERKAVIIIAIVLLILAIIGLAIYGFFAAVEINNFSIYIDSEGSRVLSLSDTSHFVPGTQHLEVKGPEYMDNTSLHLVPMGSDPIKDRLVDIVAGDGQQSSKEDYYFASSFYLKNVTEEKQYFNEFFKINECTQGVDKALRVMLVRDYEVTVYAQTDDEGNPEKVVPTEKDIFQPITFSEDEQGKISMVQGGDSAWMAEPFYNDEYVFYNEGHSLEPGEIRKYSIVVWLEGWDKDCVDEIIGGLLKIDFAFEVIGG